MSLRILSVVPPFVSLFFFSAFVVAGVNVTANCTSSFAWTFNSHGQSPCTVAANMLATCYSGSYTLAPYFPLETALTSYDGPNLSNECECSTVGYSLISACVACQGEPPIYWSAFTEGCVYPLPLPASQFPNPVPAGVYVPHWAILDVTSKNIWNANDSSAAGDSPEYGPGAIFGPNSVYTSSTGTYTADTSSTGTYTSSTRFTTTPFPSSNGGHPGVIAGGVIGGIATSSIVVAAVFYLRRRRSQAAFAGVGASQPILNDGTVAGPSLGPPLTTMLYNPNDPTTFPGYQAGPRLSDVPSASQVILPPHVGSGSTPADMQTSFPRARGYRGLPMPSA